MTIMKAIAMAALAGTLLAGPSAAIAQTAEHGNSATAHEKNEARKAEHDLDKAARAAERETRKAEHQANQNDDQDDQDDQDTEDDADDGTGGSGDVGGDVSGDVGSGAGGEVGGNLNGHGRGLAKGQPNFGTIVSSLHRNGGASATLDLTKLSEDYTVSDVDLGAYAGGKMHAIDNALKNVDATEIQDQLDAAIAADADLKAALEAQIGTDKLDSVAYAYVDASGNLVVFTK